VSATGGGGVAGQSGAAGNLGAGGGGGAATATGGAGGGHAGTNGASALLVPAQGVLLGAFVGTGTLAGFEGELGRKIAINHNFVGWTDDFTSMLPSLAAGGRIPLVTWEAWENSVGAPLTGIIGGTYDSMITARAQAVKAFGQKFFLRWGHEMNGNWYPWDGSHNGANVAATTTFISAYRHIHDLFLAAGATNALWVFCPNVDSVPGDSWNQWQNYYPGDAYVDWMGFDGYNWGTVQSTSTWQAFPTIAARIYSSLATKGKPIMIPETASTELGGDKAAWIAAILPALKSTFPGIKALAWFQMNKETDWRIDSSPTAQAAFVSMVTDPYFNP
jgi:glycosyl hydrolase family 26